MGNLGDDPVYRVTDAGKKVCNLSLATNSEWYNEDGEKKEATDFHRMVAWGGIAEVANKHLAKGSAVMVTGKLSNRVYEKDGKKNYITEVNVREINILSWKKTGEGEGVAVKPVDEK